MFVKDFIFIEKLKTMQTQKNNKANQRYSVETNVDISTNMAVIVLIPFE